MTHLGVTALAVAGLWSFSSLAAEVTSSTASNACGNKESWYYSGNINKEWRTLYHSYAHKRLVPVRGFAEAMAMRRIADNKEARAFAEYWAANSLYRAGLVHVAFYGFSVLASRPVDEETIGVQTAALECLNRINYQYPTLEIPDSVTAKLSEYKANSTRHAAANSFLRRQIATGRPAAEIKKTLSLLKDAGYYHDMAEFLVAVAQQKYKDAVPFAKALLKDPPSLPEYISRYVDTLRLLYARTLFSNGEYVDASKQFQLISKNSNDLAKSLSDLAWAFYRARDHAQAIGTGINLQSGIYRRTFTPEGPMIMAMSYNELCHYPDSLKAVEYFRKNYETPYLWLDKWQKTQGSLYEQAILFLKKDPKAKSIPDRVASEWIRSPLFIARQDEINLLIEENKKAMALGIQAASIQRQMGNELLAFILNFKPHYEKSKKEAALKRQPLPNGMIADLAKLKDMVSHYMRMRKAAKPFRMILANNRPRAAESRVRLTQQIESSLQTISKRMYAQLGDIADNLHFLEVEIYQGATQDIIWQNAHPDYKKIATQFEKKERSVNAQNTLNWGQVKASDGEDQEIWEDELGAFKADLVDNCTSKDKYLSVKRKASSN